MRCRSLAGPVLVCALIGAVACGDGKAAKSADDIASGLKQAIRQADPGEYRVTEAQTESAAKSAVCDGLNAYSSKPAESLNDQIERYAQGQQVGSQYGLNQVDPGVTRRLLNASDVINDSQQASEVAETLGC